MRNRQITVPEYERASIRAVLSTEGWTVEELAHRINTNANIIHCAIANPLLVRVRRRIENVVGKPLWESQKAFDRRQRMIAALGDDPETLSCDEVASLLRRNGVADARYYWGRTRLMQTCHKKAGIRFDIAAMPPHTKK